MQGLKEADFAETLKRITEAVIIEGKRNGGLKGKREVMIKPALVMSQK